MNKDKTSPSATADKRTCYVGAKVTPMQQDTIRKLASKCNMTVSDYLLARSHDYEPKHRLTARQNEMLGTLNNCRSDIVNYTSALHGMNAANRKRLFNDHPYMLGWLNELRRLARRISDVIDELRKPNHIPSGTSNNTDNATDL